MREIQLSIATTAGVYADRWRQVDGETLRRLHRVAATYPSMRTVRLETSSGTIHFNPRHIVSVTVSERGMDRP